MVRAFATSRFALFLTVYSLYFAAGNASAQGIFVQPANQQPTVQLEDIPMNELLRQETGKAIGEEASGILLAPPTIEALQNIPDYKPDDKKNAMPIDIRLEALKEAALSYGARGGLAARAFEINAELKTRATSLDKIFDFRQLLITGPSGFMIEPPIISESVKDLLIEGDGQKAAVADAIYRINENVKIVSAPRQWRQYLERVWGKVENPPELLRPSNDEERAIWKEMVKRGWEEGYAQADEVFDQDLNRLRSDFEGMVRYRQLLAQGMVSQPFAQQIDRGVTAENKNSTMRIGDRAVVITGVPQLIPESQKWQPANR